MSTYGLGSAEPLPDGRFRARLPGKGRATLGTYPTRDEALAALIAAKGKREQTARETGAEGAFLTFGERVLDLREEDGIRGIDQERQKWKRFVVGSDFAKRGMATITPAQVSEFFRSIKRRKLADGSGTVGHRAGLHPRAPGRMTTGGEPALESRIA